MLRHNISNTAGSFWIHKKGCFVDWCRSLLIRCGFENWTRGNFVFVPWILVCCNYSVVSRYPSQRRFDQTNGHRWVLKIQIILHLALCFRTCILDFHDFFFWFQLVGVDPLQAGNAVQLIIVLGLTVGWISTYMFRVANKDMTYAQQLRDYENKVMEVSLHI